AGAMWGQVDDVLLYHLPGHGTGLRRCQLGRRRQQKGRVSARPARVQDAGIQPQRAQLAGGLLGRQHAGLCLVRHVPAVGGPLLRRHVPYLARRGVPGVSDGVIHRDALHLARRNRAAYAARCLAGAGGWVDSLLLLVPVPSRERAALYQRRDAVPALAARIAEDEPSAGGLRQEYALVP